MWPHAGYEPSIKLSDVNHSAACSPCPMSTYKDTVANTQCTRCPAFSNTSLTPQQGRGVASLTNRSEGSGLAGKRMKGADELELCVCIEGYTSTTSSSASAHFSALTSSAATSRLQRCAPCAPGTYKDFHGMGECIPCARGTHSPTPAASACALCPPGTYSAGENAQECSLCAPGSFSPSFGSTVCVDCSPGYVTGKLLCSIVRVY
jgi:hypothetical protein